MRARAIMRAEDRSLADDAFMAGMLHGIGALLLATRAPALWGELQRDVASSGERLHVVEQRRGGATHATAGAYLLGIWGLPLHIVEAVAHHNAPSAVVERTGKLDVLGAVHAASALLDEADDVMHDAPTLDVAYLTSINCADRVAAWRALAQGLLHHSTGN